MIAASENGPGKKRLGKIMISGLLGAVAGYGAIVVLMAAAGGTLRLLGLSALLLAGVGVNYLLIGLFVALGTLLPGAGARFLNVAGREDLVDQRAVLLGSAASCLALGAAMAALALSGPAGLLPDSAVLAVLAAAMMLTAAITWRQWPRYDELTRQVSGESSGIALAIAFPLLTVWAALAHLGRVAAVDPLGVVAGLGAALLLGSFVAAGRRGLLTPH